MQLRLTAILLLLLAGLLCTRGADSVTDRSWVIGGLNAERARQLVATHATSPVEGLWRASADGAVVAIIGSDAPGISSAMATGGQAQLLIIIIDSPVPTIASGTVMGWAKQAAKPGKWQAQIFTENADGTLTKPRPFTLTEADGNHLTMASARTGWRLQVWKALPYLWRSPLGTLNEREKDLDGFIRLWPLDASTPPPFPIYL